ncbi:MAG TPA: hypothetical protein VLA04_04520, partial [Verrucomicrobiae bacterium]|nr:hypothetical protein [Verrucomicrobiae bacterium]
MRSLLGATLAVGAIAVFGFSTLLPVNQVQAAADQLPFSARLTTPSGFNVPDGTYSVLFKLYTAATGGSPVWTETHSTTVTRGEFAVYLGSVTPLTGVNFQGPLFLSFKVEGDPEMSPRYELGSVPNALNSAKLNNLDSSAYFQKAENETITGDTTFSGTATFNDGATFTGGIAIQPAAVSGNALAVNTVAGFTGNLLSLQVNGSDRLTVNQAGNITATGTLTSGALSVTGNSTITGTLGGLTGLTVVSGGAAITGNSTITGTLGGLTGLTVVSGGAAITGNSSVTGTLGVSSSLTAAAITSSGQFTNTYSPSVPAAGWAIAAQGTPLNTPNAPVVAIGNGGFTGGINGFAGSGNGTLLGINTDASFAGNLVDFQVAGASKFQATATGNVTTAGSLTVTSGGISVSAGGFAVTGNSTLVGTLTGLTGLTVASGGADITGDSQITGALTVTDTLTLSNGADVTGGIDNNGDGITNAGAISGATTIDSTGAINGLSISGGIISVGTWQGSIVDVQYGGTGAGSFTANGVLYGNGTGPIQATAAGNNGECLITAGGVPAWGGCATSGSGSTLQATYDNGNVLNTTNARDLAINLTNTGTDSNFTVTVADDSTGYVSFVRANGAGTNDPAQLFLLDNLDINRALPIALKIQSAAGGLTTAVDLSDPDIVSSLALGANDITGTNFGLTGSTGAIIGGTYNGQTVSSVANFTGSLAVANGFTVTTGTVSLPAGQVDNTELANSSLTVTAGTNLQDGGLVALGDSITLNVVDDPTFAGLVTADAGLAVTGGIDNNGDGITNAGAISGATTGGFSSDVTVGGTLGVTSTINGATISGGTLSGGNVSGGTLSSSAVNGLSVAAGVVSVGQWQGTAVGVQYGGTGAGSFTSNGLLYGNGTGALQVTAAGVSGQIPVANVSGVPTFVTLSSDATLAASGALTLSTVNSNVGSFGSATQVPVVTVDAKGRITAVSNTTVTGVTPGGTAGGDLSGSYPNPTVAKINGVALGSTTAIAGNLLIGSGTDWVTQALSGDATISSLGVLTIADNAITTDKIFDGNVTNAKLTNDSVTITAGSGLTNGGAVALGGSTTINVGAGTNITVNANDIAVVSNPTFAGLVTADAGLAVTGGIDNNGDGITNAGAISGGTTAVFGTSVTTPLIAGGTLTGGDLSLQSTTHGTKGNVYFNGTTAYVDGSSNLFGAALNVGTGAVTSGLVNGQTISSAASFTGTVTAATGLTVSAGGADITGDITLAGNLLPSGSRDVGATGTRFANGYFTTLDVNTLTVNTSSTVNGQFIVSSTTSPQLTVKYDNSNYLTTAVSSAGAVTFDAVGAGASFTFSDGVTANVFASSGVTITGGSINGTTIGASSRSTGAFTSLAANNGVTVSSGGAAITGNSNVTGTLGVSSTLTASNGFTLSAGVLTLPSSSVTNAFLQNSSLTVTAGTNLQDGGLVALGDSITLNVVDNPTFAGLVTAEAGLDVTGGIDNNDDGITNVGAISGATTIGANDTATLSKTGGVALQVTGAPAGNGSSSLLQIGSAITGGSASGTFLGMNTTGGFSGNLLDFQVGGTNVFKVTAAGVLTAASTINGATISGGTLSGGSVSGGTFSGGAVSGGSLSAAAVNGLSVAAGVISAGEWQGSTIGVTYGGTGLDAVVTGDVLFASAADTLSALAIGGDGSCLIVTSGVPAWGSCLGGATADSLQQAYDAGNTITTTDGNDLAVTLANTATDANFRINIATSSTGKFAVQSNGTDLFRVTSSENRILSNGLIIDAGGLTVTTGTVSLPAGQIGNAELANSSLTITPGTNLQDGGLVSLGGSVTLNVVDNPTFAGLLTASAGLSVTGGIDNNDDGITNAGAISGATTIDATGAITGGTISDGTLSVTSGALTGGTTAVFGTSVTTPLIAGGTLTGGNLSLQSTTHGTKGNVYFNGTTAYVDGSSNLFGAALNVGAGTITSGLINGQDIDATANFTGTVTAATGLTVSAGGADITGDVTLAGNLLPSGSRDIGATGTRFANGFFTALNVNSLTVNTSSTVNGQLVVSSTTSPQLTVKYDNSNYLTTAVSSAGAVTFDAVGAGAAFTFSDGVTANVFASSGVTITGGSIDGTPIGASSRSTGAFTTLAANAGLTVSAGGASITGDITTVTNITATGTIAGATINATTALQTAGTTRVDASGNLTNIGNITGTAGVQLQATAGTLALAATGANIITASTNGSERFRINDTGAVVAANGSLTLTGGTSFPSSPSEGQMFFRTDTKQLYVYANAKWQADRSTATLIVAASDSQNKEKADYVADGTGDQTEINAAITALPSTGGLVYLLDGTYSVSASVAIAKSNVSLVGAGKSAVLSRAWNETTSTQGAVVVLGDGASSYGKITVSGFTIDSNGATYTHANNTAIALNTRISDSEVSNMYLTKSSTSANAIYLNGSSGAGLDRIRIVGNSFVNTSAVGTGLTTTYTTQSVFSGNTFYRVGAPMNFNTSSTGNTITGNTISTYTCNAFAFFNNASYNTVTGNTFTGNSCGGGNGAIYMVTSHNLVSNNTIFSLSGTTDGIYLHSSSSYNTVIGNRIYDVGGSTSRSGIYVAGSYSIVSNNDITDTAGSGYAIEVVSGATGTVLSNNRYSGTGAAAISDAGTGTIYNSQLFGSDIVMKGTANIGINTTGPDRRLDILDASAPQLRLTTTDGSVYGDFQNTANANAILTGSNLASAAARQYGLAIQPTIAQSSTGAYTALLVNATENSLGAGPNYLLDLQVAGTSKLSVTNSGALTIASALTVSAGGASITGGLNNNAGGITNAG